MVRRSGGGNRVHCIYVVTKRQITIVYLWLISGGPNRQDYLVTDLVIVNRPDHNDQVATCAYLVLAVVLCEWQLLLLRRRVFCKKRLNM